MWELWLAPQKGSGKPRKKTSTDTHTSISRYDVGILVCYFLFLKKFTRFLLRESVRHFFVRFVPCKCSYYLLSTTLLYVLFLKYLIKETAALARAAVFIIYIHISFTSYHRHRLRRSLHHQIHQRILRRSLHQSYRLRQNHPMNSLRVSVLLHPATFPVA